MPPPTRWSRGEDTDREAIETIIAGDVAFISPFDHRLDRGRHFGCCQPNAEVAEKFEILFDSADGNCAAMTDDAVSIKGHSLRNIEVFTAVEGQVTEVAGPCRTRLTRRLIVMAYARPLRS